jgi:hypothetical protein
VPVDVEKSASEVSKTAVHGRRAQLSFDAERFFKSVKNSRRRGGLHGARLVVRALRGGVPRQNAKRVV